MKTIFKPGNMLYPLPAVMVSCQRPGEGANIITIAWTGTVCTNPPCVSISIRPSRYSYKIIKDTGEFVINLVTKELTGAMDLCGVKSGRDVDKFLETGLTLLKSQKVEAPGIAQSPVNIECRVKDIIPLGSHDMFIAEVVSVTVDDNYMEENGRFNLNAAGLVAYSHGEYFTMGERTGSFGFSVKKRSSRKKREKQ